MPIVVNPLAHANRIRTQAGKLWALPAGTLTDATFLASLSTSVTAGQGQFVSGTAANTVPGSALALPLGITKTGMVFKNALTTANIESAEYYYPHKVVGTAQVVDLTTTLITVNATNLRLAFNAATSQVTGTPDASDAAKLVPPLVGQEVRCQLVWESNAADHVIIIWQALQTGAVSLNAAKGNANMDIPLTFTAELPDSTIAPAPYAEYFTGTSWVETVNTD